MNEPPILSPQPQKTWWDRNWKWFLPSVGLSALAFAAGAVVLFVALIFSLLKSSDIYQQALTQAQNDPAVVRALGSPVTPGLWVSGNINVNGTSGKAELAIPIKGPRDRGTVYVAASKAQGQWQFDDLVVEVKTTHQRIDLLAAPPEPDGPSEPPPDEKTAPPPPDSIQI